MELKTKKEKYALRQNDVEAMFVSTADEGAVHSLCQFAKVVVYGDSSDLLRNPRRGGVRLALVTEAGEVELKDGDVVLRDSFGEVSRMTGSAFAKRYEPVRRDEIVVMRSPTADSRTCDHANVPIHKLFDSSVKHIVDVQRGIEFVVDMLRRAGRAHDSDKIGDLASFHELFRRGFKREREPWWRKRKKSDWYDRHLLFNRHHLSEKAGVPVDVNLVDVIEMAVDCVVAGMARSGSVYDVKIPGKVLAEAFKNTVELLKSKVRVVD